MRRGSMGDIVLVLGRRDGRRTGMANDPNPTDPIIPTLLLPVYDLSISPRPTRLRRYPTDHRRERSSPPDSPRRRSPLRNPPTPPPSVRSLSPLRHPLLFSLSQCNNNQQRMRRPCRRGRISTRGKSGRRERSNQPAQRLVDSSKRERSVISRRKWSWRKFRRRTSFRRRRSEIR